MGFEEVEGQPVYACDADGCLETAPGIIGRLPPGWVSNWGTPPLLASKTLVYCPAHAHLVNA